MNTSDLIDTLAQDLANGADLKLETITAVTGELSQNSEVEFSHAEDVFYKKLIDYLSSPKFYQQNYAVQESVMKLFDQLSDHYTFESFTERIASLQMIIDAIDKTTNSLVFLSLANLISKASPIDILANTELIKNLILKLSSGDVSIAIVNSVETLILKLSQGQLIRRRLLSKEVISILIKMRHANIEITVRLFDLIANVYLEFVQLEELPIALFKIDNEELGNDDIMYPVSIINFYTKLLDKIVAKNMTWLLNELDFDLIIDLLYDEDYKFKGFITNEILIMLGKLSYCKDKFSQIDQKYDILHKITNEYYSDTDISTYLLSMLNPVLLQDNDDFLTNLKLSSKTMPIFNNLITNRDIFNKLTISTSDLKKLPSMMEFFTILEQMSEHSWSSTYLLNSLPLIMNLLLDSIVVNPQLVDFKKQILTNLLLHHGDLTIWDDKIKSNLKKLINGVDTTPQVNVHDSIL